MKVALPLYDAITKKTEAYLTTHESKQLVQMTRAGQDLQLGASIGSIDDFAFCQGRTFFKSGQMVYEVAEQVKEIGPIPNLAADAPSFGKLFSIDDRLYVSSGVGISVLHNDAFNYERKCNGFYFSFAGKAVCVVPGQKVMRVKPGFIEEEISTLDNEITEFVCATSGVVVFGNKAGNKQKFIDICNCKVADGASSDFKTVECGDSLVLTDSGYSLSEDCLKKSFGAFRRVFPVAQEAFKTYMEAQKDKYKKWPSQYKK